MAYDHDFDCMLAQTVVVTTRASHSVYGTASYSTNGSTYRARVVAKPGFVRSQTGENIAVKTVVWVASTGSIHPSDQITLPDGTTPPVLAVESYPDEDGAHYFNKVMLGF